MKKKPVKVSLIGTEKSNYKIKFPYLDVPVVVNEYFYNKMKNSDKFLFTNEKSNSQWGTAHS